MDNLIPVADLVDAFSNINCGCPHSMTDFLNKIPLDNSKLLVKEYERSGGLQRFKYRDPWGEWFRDSRLGNGEY